MQHSPEEASELGDRRWNDRWSDESLEAYAQENQHAKDVLIRLAKINRGSLNAADQLNYDLFKKDFAEEIEGYKYRRFLVPLNQRGGIQTEDELGDSLRFETVKDYEDWIARLKSFPRSDGPDHRADATGDQGAHGPSQSDHAAAAGAD